MLGLPITSSFSQRPRPLTGQTEAITFVSWAWAQKGTLIGIHILISSPGRSPFRCCYVIRYELSVFCLVVVAISSFIIFLVFFLKPAPGPTGSTPNPKDEFYKAAGTVAGLDFVNSTATGVNVSKPPFFICVAFCLPPTQRKSSQPPR